MMNSKLEHEIQDQIRRCSSCGFCQAYCPIFGLTKRAALNARGKMLVLKEVLDGRAEYGDELVETLFQCTNCKSCAVNCPSGVDVPGIISEVRKEMTGLGYCHPAFTGLAEMLGEHTNIYGALEPEDFDRERNRKAEVVYFMGCVGQYREEEVTGEVLDLLDRINVDYTLIDEVCCAGVLEDIGQPANTDLAQINLELIHATGAKTVVTGCPKCMLTFKHKPQYAGLSQAGVEVMHLSQFLAGFNFGVTTDKVVTYHDPCDLGRHSGIYDDPRKIIAGIAPNFKEMPHNREQAICCGAGGGVRGAYPANSIGMARRRLDEAEAVGAEVVLTECNSCVHNFSNAKLRKQKISLYTTAQFINELMEED